MLMRYEEEFANLNDNKAPTSLQSKVTIEKNMKITELTERYEQGVMTQADFLSSVRAIVRGS